jgi:very-short-patch-repair endonuclease
VLDSFIVGFACFEARLIVEVDGATHSTDEEIAGDAVQSAALAASAFEILRFTNGDVYQNLDGVLETIWATLIELRPRIEDPSSLRPGVTPHPDLPPQGGREVGRDRR